MRDHYIICNHGGGHRRGPAMRVASPDFSGDWQRRYFPGGTWRTVDAHRVFEETPNGMTYFWELSGPDGIWVMLFADPDASAKQIAESKEFLRTTQDTTGIAVFRVTEWTAEPALEVA